MRPDQVASFLPVFLDCGALSLSAGLWTETNGSPRLPRRASSSKEDAVIGPSPTSIHGRHCAPEEDWHAADITKQWLIRARRRLAAGHLAWAATIRRNVSLSVWRPGAKAINKAFKEK